MIKVNRATKSWFWWSLLTIFLGVIFLFTAFQAFTGEHTKTFIQNVTGMDEKNAYVMNSIIRKSAHILMYGFLGILLYSVIRKRSIWYAWLCSTGIAALDEWHQSLVPGRSPLIQDVMLDSLAAFAFLLGAALIKSR
ncbi:VanZ like family protein [compost metagenome]